MKKFMGKVQQGLDRLDLDKKGSASASGSSGTASQAPPPTSVDSPPSKRDIYLHRKQRGVNLGSWFSLEGWLTPSLFQQAREPKDSELDVVEGMDPNEARSMLDNHWDNFINQDDLQWMVDHGINTVRIPVGYFHFLAGHPDEQVRSLLKGTDYEKHAPVYQGAYSRIQRAVETAAQRNIGVLIDLHGAPGGQNADGHCGVSGGKAALWSSQRDQDKTIQILVAMAREYARFENVVGLELINEPKNSGKLQSFYEKAIAQIRAASPEAAALPLYLGDAWDTNHYTGLVGQHSRADNFLVADHHLYRCFTQQDHKTRSEEHAQKLHPGTSPHPGDQNGCGETARWVQSMSQRCGRSMIVGEWSAALNPLSLQHLGSHEQQRPSKAEFAHNQWKTFDKFCAGYFFWTLKKEGGPDNGWGLYSAVEEGVMPQHLDPHKGRRKSAQELESARQGAQQSASAGHEGYWDKQKGGPYEHWRFAEGFNLAWNDSLAFLRADESNEIGFEGQWQKTRTAAHASQKGQGSKLTVAYVEGSSDPEQQLDLYLPEFKSSALVVFIHGGAWRSGSRSDHTDLANSLCERGLAVAVIDYRLSIKDEATGLPRHLHPTHVNDTLAALSYLHKRASKQQDIPRQGWTVVGHSIGAWLALAAICTENRNLPPNRAEFPHLMPRPAPEVMDAISTCVLVDGIYSVSTLLEEYPDYDGFVSQAFLPSPGPANYSVVSLENWALSVGSKKFHIWHSRDDELLSFRQTIDALDYIDRAISDHTGSESNHPVTVPTDGSASSTTLDGNNVPIAELFPSVTIANPDLVVPDFVSHRGAHDDMLHTQTFWDAVFAAAQA
ncbi:glycoside hydrolase [Testicularia cyperi]|uniref:Glycoside hydrolase n=1 Tax=Testicularia cyperi TaxID=1882483 RepID=A0A317XYE0_9BASI|nr:glycoside hydrolase [Testicularia cyperi]